MNNMRDAHVNLTAPVFCVPVHTVNSEILRGYYFHETSHRENNTLAKCQNHCRLLMEVKHALVANFDVIT